MADFSSLRGRRFGEDPEEQGIIASIVSGIARDLEGAAKTLVAPIGTVFDEFGFEVPITIEDLETRDLTGAAMVASVFVGGAGASVARSMQAGLGLRGAGLVGTKAGQAAAREFARKAGMLQNAAVLAGSEAAAGVFFGAVKPLERGEERIEEILQDAAFFGVGGGAFSMLGSAWKATAGARLAHIKGQTRAALTQDVTRKLEANRALSEFAGVELENLETGARRRIFRLQDGSVRVWDGMEKRVAENFGDAVAESLELGYTNRLGVARSTLTSSKIEGALPEDILLSLTEAGGDLSKVIDANELANYESVRKVVKSLEEEDAIIDWLSAETVTPLTDEFGAVRFGESESSRRKFRRDIMALLPKNISRKLSKIENDSEFLRAAILEGAVEVDGLAFGTSMKDFAQELVYNNVQPKGAVFMARNPYDASILAKLATPRLLARVHPEIDPMFKASQRATALQTLGMRDAMESTRQLASKYTPKVMAAVVEIVEESAEAGGVRNARRAALEAARATGDSDIINAVDEVTEILNVARLRLIGAGRLGASDFDTAQARSVIQEAVDAYLDPDNLAVQSADAVEEMALARAGDAEGVVLELLDEAGLAGYFPIVNVGNIQAWRNGEAAPAFFDSWRKAAEWVADGGSGGTVANAFATDSAVSSGVSGREFGRLIGAVREASEVEIPAGQAAQALIDSGIFPTNGPRKFSRFLQQRKLGLRDHAEEPIRALDLYLNNVERTLAWNTFEREANNVIANIPASKPALRLWAEEQKNLLLGRQTKAEKAILNLVRAVAPEVSDISVRKYSSAVRHLQGVSKLGGLLSGLVNLTQFPINTVPMLGAKYSAVGLQAVYSKSTRERVRKLAAKYQIDVGLHVNLTREGEVIGAERISREIRDAVALASKGRGKMGAKAAIEALENTWMVSFNGAERINRYSTFWGAFQKATAEGLDESAAVAFAKDMLDRTQFDYTAAAIPQALQGPIAGVLGQFKTFIINEIELFATVDNATRMKMMGMLGALGGMGSILNFPGVDVVDSMSRLFFDEKFSDKLKLAAGEEDSSKITKFVAFGLPGAARNLDFSNYIGPGGLNDIFRGLLGPTVSDLGGFRTFAINAARDVRTAGSIQQPTWNGLMQRVMPAQVRRLQRGVLIGSGRDIFQGGEFVQPPGEVRNPYSGKLLYRPEERVKAAGRAALGIPSIQDEVLRTQDEIMGRAIDNYRITRESFRRQIALAQMAGDSQEVATLRARATAAGIIFDQKEIASAVQSYARNAAERRERRTPVDLRTEFEDYFQLPVR